MNPEAVRSILKDNNIPFEEKPIQHGLQFRFKDGASDVELPSDINGLLYIPFKERVDEIKERVAAELQEAGFQINIKNLLS